MIRKLSQTLRYSSLAGALALLAGCAAPMKQPVEVDEVRAIYPVEYQPGTMNMPMGAELTPRGQVVFTVRKPGDDSKQTVGMLFGPLGVLAAHQSMKHSGEGIERLEWLQDIDMPVETSILLAHFQDAGQLPGLLPVRSAELATTSRVYELQPYLYLSVNPAKGDHVLVVLRISEQQDGSEIWKGQYVRELRLDDGQAEYNSAASLRDGVRGALRSTLRFFLADLEGTLREDSHDVVIGAEEQKPHFANGLLARRITPQIDEFQAFRAKRGNETLLGGTLILPASVGYRQR